MIRHNIIVLVVIKSNKYRFIKISQVQLSHTFPDVTEKDTIHVIIFLTTQTNNIVQVRKCFLPLHLENVTLNYKNNEILILLGYKQLLTYK